MDFRVSPRLRRTLSRQGRLESHAGIEQHTPERQHPHWQPVSSVAKKLCTSDTVTAIRKDCEHWRDQPTTSTSTKSSANSTVSSVGDSGNEPWRGGAKWWSSSTVSTCCSCSDARLPSQNCHPPGRKTVSTRQTRTTGGKWACMRQSMAHGRFLLGGVLSLNGKETHEEASRPGTASSGSVVPKRQCTAGHSAINATCPSPGEVAKPPIRSQHQAVFHPFRHYEIRLSLGQLSVASTKRHYTHLAWVSVCVAFNSAHRVLPRRRHRIELGSIAEPP